MTYAFLCKSNFLQRLDVDCNDGRGNFLPLQCLLYYTRYEKEVKDQRLKQLIQEGIYSCCNLEFVLKGELFIYNDDLFTENRIGLYFQHLPKLLPLSDKKKLTVVQESHKKTLTTRDCKTQFSIEDD